MKKVSVLCVGIGGYANVYLEAMLQHPSPTWEIVGLVDVAPAGCRFLEQLRDVPLFSTMEEFYQHHTAELCIITTPIHLHTRQILCALQNGSHVLCEKPLSGCSADEAVICRAAEAAGKFVMIGYQWSYAKAIRDLKADVESGVYGTPELLKTLVLWPRDKSYFTRGSGWAGKLTAADGTVLNDSVANNAAAHYLHNMLYVTGGTFGRSSEVTALRAELLRVNAIENFDTAVIDFTMDNGARGLFVASHSTEKTVDPCFEYRFSGGTVRYSDEEKCIVGTLADGTERRYGNPFADVNEKVFEAIAACRQEGYVPPCGVKTAAPHVRCIERVQQCPIHNVNPACVTDQNGFLCVEGLYEALLTCYEEETALSTQPAWQKWVGDQ